MTEPHAVREAALADVPAIARIHVDAWRETYAGLISKRALAVHSYEERVALWTRVLAPHSTTSLFVAERAGAIAGFASGGPVRDPQPPFDAELYSIYLKADYKRHGLGRALFEAVRTRLRERGFRAMLLWVLAGNDAALFYEALGGKKFLSGSFTLAGDELVEHGYGFEL